MHVWDPITYIKPELLRRTIDGGFTYFWLSSEIQLHPGKINNKALSVNYNMKFNNDHYLYSNIWATIKSFHYIQSINNKYVFHSCRILPAAPTSGMKIKISFDFVMRNQSIEFRSKPGTI